MRQKPHPEVSFDKGGSDFRCPRTFTCLGKQALSRDVYRSAGRAAFTRQDRWYIPGDKFTGEIGAICENDSSNRTPWVSSPSPPENDYVCSLGHPLVVCHLVQQGTVAVSSVPTVQLEICMPEQLVCTTALGLVSLLLYLAGGQYSMIYRRIAR